MILAKIENGRIITTYVEEDDHYMLKTVLADGFKPYEQETEKPEVGEFQGLNPVYVEKKGIIYHYWEIEDNNQENIQTEITRLEAELALSDYKVIKANEYSLAGVKIPYDINSLHLDREQKRILIRKLEKMLR